jgi:hypothetical protein
MGICTLIQTIFMVRGFSKKRKKVGKYEKPKQENKKKLEIYLSKNGK